MKTILRLSNQVYDAEDCCHDDERDCCCYDCLRKSFYSLTPDTYECLKKLSYYVMNYGPAFASEIYHYLSESQILESNYCGKTVKVLSLGCGFSPDLIALDKYISDKNLTIKLKYTGIDNAPLWNSLRSNDSRAQYFVSDVCSGFDMSGYDLVFINKLYSTLRKNKRDKQFIKLLIQQVETAVKVGSFLIFNDINLIDMGRDRFHASVRGLFTAKRHYFFPVENAYTGNYMPISDTKNIFQLPINMTVSPKPGVTKAIIFEYRK